MPTNWIPVNKELVRALSPSEASLAAEVNDLMDARMSIQEEEIVLSEFKVYQRQIRKSASTAISVSPFFKGDGSYEDFQFRYFAGAFSDTYRYIQGQDASIIAERFGLGIDIDLKVTDIETSIKGGFGSIAAAVEMGIASAEYSYHVQALPQGQFHDLLPPVGRFDSDAMSQFKKLITRLKELYADSWDELELVAIEVLIASAFEEERTENAPSYYFAAKKIIEEYSLEEAVKEARVSAKSYNEDAIQYLYSRAGLNSLEAKPTSRNIEVARKFIFE